MAGHCGISISKAYSFSLTSLYASPQSHNRERGRLFYNIYPPESDRLCTNWLPLFKTCNAYDAVYKWFDHLEEQGNYIIGYVIMSSHVHAIIAFCNSGKSINAIVSNGKRFIAYDLVKRLKEKNSALILKELNNDLNNTEKKEAKI